MTLKGVWPSFLVWRPPWLYASLVKNKIQRFKRIQYSQKKFWHTKFSFKVKFSPLQRPIVYPLQNFLLSSWPLRQQLTIFYKPTWNSTTDFNNIIMQKFLLNCNEQKIHSINAFFIHNLMLHIIFYTYLSMYKNK